MFRKGRTGYKHDGPPDADYAGASAEIKAEAKPEGTVCRTQEETLPETSRSCPRIDSNQALRLRQ